MIIRKYNIELVRLTEQDIELVRHHRNSDAIRSKMFFQESISKDAQKEWFSSIDNASNYYFIVIWKGNKIGLIHGTIVSLEQKITTGGVFFWDDEVLLTYVPVCASIIMGDLTFFLLKMKQSTAIVRSDNNRALQFNEKLGYKRINTSNNKVYLQLNFDDYRESEIRRLVKRISKDTYDLAWKDIELSSDEMENRSDLFISEFLEQYIEAQKVDA